MMEWLQILAPALIIGSVLSLLAAPLGCLVLWRRMAFFSDTLAHSSLLGLTLAFIFELPIWLGLVGVTLLIVFLIWFAYDDSLPNDALLSGIATTLLALGLILISYFDELKSSMSAFLFGDLLTLSWTQVPYYVAICIGALAFLYKIWSAQLRLSIEPDIATIEGVKIKRQKLLFMVLLACFCAVALQAVGSLLISSLLILPALSARLMAKSPIQMVIFAIIISQVCFFFGVASSIYFDVASGLAVVLMLGILFFILLGTKKLTGE